ncbi:DsrE family protein [Thalassotalea mangrovi]|uniref:Uncharacterized protein n=1 Tax=Thalassotalea mangrovi TaxID=2572245 RepID=A0A4U1BAG8_9GAMM|nr:DsrE family protein [Thalassotalea mangrovi]TKB47523.1 hypothetical protein E8M12_01695 [Thalassotalea mangrovi]
MSGFSAGAFCATVVLPYNDLISTMLKNLILAVSLPFTLVSTVIQAKVPEFTTGPVIKNYGQNAPIANALPNPEQQSFKIIFDISEGSQDDKLNANYNTVARYINMHARAGVATENIKVAMIVHGKATAEMVSSELYKKQHNKDDVNDELIQALLAAGVDIYVCGQSASYYQIEAKDLKPGIKMALSAMTANQLLQQQGYILNPF